MQILHAHKPEEARYWLSLWEAGREREVFAHPGYAGLFAGNGTQACAAVLEQEQGSVLYPFLLRDLQKEPFWQPAAGRAFDIITPYGYGGPELITQNKTPDAEKKAALYQNFFRAFHAWCMEKGVVSEFVRFSLFSEAIPHYYGKTEQLNDNIVCDLRQGTEALWKGFRHKVRKNVRTAREHGLRVEEDPVGRRLDDFMEVYHATMKRRNAGSFYFFPEKFFKSLLDKLPGQCCFFHVTEGNKVVASELVLCSVNRGYSYLGGTLEEYFPRRPGDLLKVHILEWAHHKGLKELVIGGGYKPHDGIFAFKQAFAPKGIRPFYCGKTVFDKHKYQLLTRTKEQNHSEFFPAYRAGRQEKFPGRNPGTEQTAS